MASYNEISVANLSRLMGTPDCPILLDVRINEDFDDDPRLIPGAYQLSVGSGQPGTDAPSQSATYTLSKAVPLPK